MASVSFRNVEKSFGSTRIIHGIGFDIADGEFTVLVGPSGCGKSTLLRMLAGLEEISGGTIAIDDHVVNDIESKDRDIAMVFQSYALYPHMTVADNMGFSLRLRKADPALTNERVAHAARILQPRPVTSSAIRASSRAASASASRWGGRSSATRRCSCSTSRSRTSTPSCAWRCAPRSRPLHQRLKTTTVYVTHDQVEAMTMADRIVVMQDGRIEQIGTPLELYDHPANLFVAQFIGSPAMNVVSGTLRRDGGQAWVEAEGGVRWPVAPTSAGRDGQAVAYGVRPGDLGVGGGADACSVPAEVIVVEPTGRRDRAAGPRRRIAIRRRPARPYPGRAGRNDPSLGRHRRRPSLRSDERHRAHRLRQIRLRLTP